MLGIAVTSPDGTVKRWAVDEPNPGDRPDGLAMGTVMPGGFDTMSCSLARRPDDTWADLNPFDDVRVYDRGGARTVWEGRAAQFPGSMGEQPVINFGAVGYQAALTDQPGFRSIYIDRDMTKWGPPSSARRIAMIDANNAPGEPSLLPARKTGQPSLALVATSPWVAAALPSVEGWYDAGGGLTIRAFYYAWKTKRDLGLFNLKAGLSNDDSSNDQTDTLAVPSTGQTGTTVATGNPRFASLRWIATAADPSSAGNDGKTHEAHFTGLAVYGDVGIYNRLSGAEPERGYVASDVVTDILSQAAPDIDYTTGPDGTIRPTSYVIPHLSFTDPVTPAEAIGQANAYDLFEWAVWDDRMFHYRSIDPDRRCWEGLRSDGAVPSLEGPQADDVYNGVVVIYQNVSGETKVIGPPAATNVDATDDQLQDDSANNACNQHGLRRWGTIKLDTPTVKSAAVQLGSLWLIEHSQPQRRGTITLGQVVRRPSNGALEHSYMVRAGDHIRIPDLQEGADVQHRIIKTDYNHASGEMTLTVDNTPHLMDALFGRLAADFTGLV